MKRTLALVAIGLLLIVSVAWWQSSRTLIDAAPHRASAPAIHVQTRHYAITSTASAEQTRLVAGRVESLHDAYVAFFSDTLGAADRDRTGLQLILFRDRTEFKDHNDSEVWAEAFYRPPACRAYFEAGARNPYHWMLHEVVHQLNDQVAHRRLPRWINEGLASYFGASAIEDGKLVPGRIDPDTYPIWWLRKMELTGDLQADIAARRIIPLRQLIGETKPLTVDDDVNLHYIEFWSLSHFLIHTTTVATPPATAP